MNQHMHGKTVVITGGSSGIGAVAARRLAQRGATVVPVGRSPDATAAIAAEVGSEPLTADFARLADVRALAERLLERYAAIDVLAHNAGGMFGERRVTEDGHELTMQVNYFAPFLLQVTWRFETLTLLSRSLLARSTRLSRAHVDVRHALGSR